MMKTILTAVFAIPLLASAQDSCQLRKETDAFTHQTKISTGFITFPYKDGSLSISIDATSSDIDFFLWFTSDSKCFDDASTIQVNYDGDRIKGNFKNGGSMNCEGAFHINFKNTPSTPGTLQRLTDKKISSLHIVGPNKTFTDVTFTDEQKAKLMKMAGCVVRESKTLLKQ
jgi:hypothetical protein